MLPAKINTNTVQLHRTLDASEEELLDALSEFALKQDLEIDHRWNGEGLLFRRAPKGAGVKHLLRRGDSLHVTITAVDGMHEIDFVADLSASIARRDERRRSRIIKGSVIGAGLMAIGIAGLTHNGVSFGDFIPMFFGVGFGRRALGRVRAAASDRDAIERRVANELARLCARIDDPTLLEADPPDEGYDDDDED